MQLFWFLPTHGDSRYPGTSLGACAAERVEAKWVGKEPNLPPILRTVAVATAGKTAAKWDFSPSIAADSLLPRRLLGARTINHHYVKQRTQAADEPGFDGVLIPTDLSRTVPTPDSLLLKEIF